MKKLITTLICLLVLSMTALPVAAQTRSRRSNIRSIARYDNRENSNRDYRTDAYRNQVYSNDTYPNSDYGYEDRSVWDKSRDKITTAGGAVGGAILGGLIGGKKGAIIGAITGGAGAAIYTYKIRNKDVQY